MELTHRFRVAAPLDRVFEAFSDLEELAPCFPGATLTSVEGDRFSGTLAVKLGSLPLHYRGTGSYRERSAARHRVVVQARGEDERGLGGAVAVATVQLRRRGAATDVVVDLDLDLTGQPGRYGSAVVSEITEKLFAQFADGLAQRLGADGSEPTATRRGWSGLLRRRR